MKKITRRVRLVVFLAFVFPAFIAGCADMPWNQKKLARPRVGMSPEQVINDTWWGRPGQTKTLSTAGGRTEIWYWGWYNQQWVVFTNGSVSAVYD